MYIILKYLYNIINFFILINVFILVRKFEEAMTPQEKEKLYRAIDYQENGVPVHYPETYEMIDTRFLLYELQIIILDTDKNYPCIMDLQLHSVEACFKSRPSANAILYICFNFIIKILILKF